MCKNKKKTTSIRKSGWDAAAVAVATTESAPKLKCAMQPSWWLKACVASLLCICKMDRKSRKDWKNASKTEHFSHSAKAYARNGDAIHFFSICHSLFRVTSSFLVLFKHLLIFYRDFSARVAWRSVFGLSFCCKQHCVECLNNNRDSIARACRR